MLLTWKKGKKKWKPYKSFCWTWQRCKSLVVWDSTTTKEHLFNTRRCIEKTASHRSTGDDVKKERKARKWNLCPGSCWYKIHKEKDTQKTPKKRDERERDEGGGWGMRCIMFTLNNKRQASSTRRRRGKNYIVYVREKDVRPTQRPETGRDTQQQ